MRIAVALPDVITPIHDPAADNARRADDVVAALRSAGVQMAFVAPGSRSTPLVLAVHRQAMTTHVVLDERVAGFCALGAGRIGTPAVVITTSGTAVANLLPAACEADRDAVPWVACTADRPQVDVDAGANQTLAQAALLTGAARAVVDVGAATDDVAWPQPAVQEALRRSLGGPDRGPLHLNIRFDKPLEPPAAWPAPMAPARRAIADNDGINDVDSAALRELVGSSAGLVVCGSLPVDERADAARLLAWLGWPAIIDVTSGVVPPPTVPRLPSVALRAPVVRESIRPGAVLWLGGPTTEDTVGLWLAQTSVSVVQVASPRRRRLPPGLTPHQVRVSPAAALRALQASGVVAGTSDLIAVVTAVADAARDRRGDGDVLGADVLLTEPRVAQTVLAAQRAGDIVFVGNSMPVRDADRFAVVPPGVTLLVNRGVSGIDGNIATALGACLASGRSTTVFIGDLTFLHDLSGAAAVVHARAPLRIVVVNNGGGGIFSFLPIAASSAGADVTERFFGTPHSFDLSAMARAIGYGVVVCDDVASLHAALATSPSAPEFVEVKTSRTDNVAVHAALDAALARRCLAAIGRP